jgi:hypothetical protein
MSGKNRILKNLYKQAGRAYFSVYVSLYETKKNAKIPYKSIIYGGGCPTRILNSSRHFNDLEAIR